MKKRIYLVLTLFLASGHIKTPPNFQVDLIRDAGLINPNRFFPEERCQLIAVHDPWIDIRLKNESITIKTDSFFIFDLYCDEQLEKSALK